MVIQSIFLLVMVLYKFWTFIAKCEENKYSNHYNKDFINHCYYIEEIYIIIAENLETESDVESLLAHTDLVILPL